MRPRALVIAPYLPAEGVSGGCTQLASLLRALGAAYDVDWVSFDLPAMDRRAFASAGRLLARFARDAVIVPFHGTWRDNRFTLRPEDLPIYATPEIEAAVARRARNGYDVVQAEFECMAPIAAFARGGKTFLTVHELNVLRRLRLARSGPLRQRPFNLAEVVRSIVWDRLNLKGFDGIAVFNPVEARLLRVLFPRTPVTQLPIAVYCRTPNPEPRTPYPGHMFDLVFVGNFTHPPNADALAFLLGDIMPRLPGRTLLVVGGNMDPALEQRARAAPGASVHGPTPRPRELICRARVAVAPLRLGGGARLKVIEALAAGVPVVATRIGAEGIRVKPGAGFVIADGAEGFAQAIEATLANIAEARRDAVRCRDEVKKNHSTGALQKAMTRLYAGRPPTISPSGRLLSSS